MKGFTGRLIIVTLAWLFGFYAPARAALPAAAPEKSAGRPAQGALYRVSDGHHSILLFGTIHVGLPAFYPLEPRLAQALAHAPALALELDPDNAGAMQSAMRKYGLLGAGQHYADHLAPDLAARTREAIAQSGLQAPAVDNFRPWLLAITLTVQAYEAAGYQTRLAVDNHLAALMRARGKPVLELESAEAQLGLMAGLSAADEQRFLADTLDDIGDADSQRKIEDLVSAWRHADHGALEQALDAMRQEDSFTDRFTLHTLLDGRNPGLADGVARLLQQHDQAVAAVGVLHLVGPRSIPELLRRRGLSVEQLY